MFDFSKPITKEDIINTYSQELLFEKYLGDKIIFGKKYKNPFRVDKSPGCHFFYKGNILYFSDISKAKMYNIFDFVMELNKCTFIESLNIIRNNSNVNKIVTNSSQEKEITLIQFQHKSFNNDALAYWNQYNIGIDILQKEHIYLCDKVWINKTKQYISPLTFAYYYPDINKVKIYQPLANKDNKWKSTVPHNYVEGINDLSFDTDFIIITKSKKDRIVLKEIFPDVCNIQAENRFCITDNFTKFLDKNYINKYCFFDNDKTGKEANKSLNELGYKWINIPNYMYDEYNIKDPSDYVKKFKEYNFLKKLINSKCN